MVQRILLDSWFYAPSLWSYIHDALGLEVRELSRPGTRTADSVPTDAAEIVFYSCDEERNSRRRWEPVAQLPSLAELQATPRKHPVLWIEWPGGTGTRTPKPEEVGQWLNESAASNLIVTVHDTGRDGVTRFLLQSLQAAAGHSPHCVMPKSAAHSGQLWLPGHSTIWSVEPYPSLEVREFRHNRRHGWGWVRSRRPMEAWKQLRKLQDQPEVQSFISRIPRHLQPVYLHPWIRANDIATFAEAFPTEVGDLLQGGAYLLVLMLACYKSLFARSGDSRPTVKELLRMRQRDAWAAFDLPATEAVARIARKVPVESCHFQTFLALRSAVQSSRVFMLLSHLDRINYGAIAAAGHRLATPALLHEVGHCSDEDRADRNLVPPTRRLLNDIVEEASHRDARDLLRPVESRAHARQMAMRVVDRPLVGSRRSLERTRRARVRVGTKLLVRPSGISKLIVPLLGPRDLDRESETMEHCVAIYASRVANRTSAIYRVLPEIVPGVERVTLELVAGTTPQEPFRLAQLKGPGNCQVSEQTHRLVEAWLRQVNLCPTITAKELAKVVLKEMPRKRKTPASAVAA